MEDPTPLGLYLGCKHTQGKVTLPNGNVAKTISYDMEDFLDSCVTRYIDLATEIQGAAPKNRVVGVPCLEDGRGESPFGSPCAPTGTPGVFCPWCNNNFPIAGNESDPIEALREVECKKTKAKKKAKEEAEQSVISSAGFLRR